jgi:NADP-dependent 3-hydroxy acid dehydrogenase YdfG
VPLRGRPILSNDQGSGVGRATAAAFSEAGASKIVLLGRNEAPLKETASGLATPHSVHAVDITNEKALRDAAAATGTWDILIIAAGYISTPGPVSQSAVDEWWQSFEVCTTWCVMIASAHTLADQRQRIDASYPNLPPDSQS